MFFWLRYFVAALCFVPLAPSAGESLRWRCWYDQQIHIVCLVDTLPVGNQPISEAVLPSNLPAIVKQLRRDPGAFRNRVLQVPLHTVPYDMEFTAVLAKAAMCGSRRDCTVNFTASVPPAAEIAALVNQHLPGPSAENSTAPAFLGED